MSTTPENEALIREFCAAWERRDMEEILGFFTDDAVYHNIPMDPVEGHAGIRSVLEFFVPGASKIEFEILGLASAGDVVFTERVDRFVMGENEVELPVAGVFEVRDGRITAWRDYFDLQTWMSQSGA